MDMSLLSALFYVMMVVLPVFNVTATIWLTPRHRSAQTAVFAIISVVYAATVSAFHILVVDTLILGTERARFIITIWTLGMLVVLLFCSFPAIHDVVVRMINGLKQRLATKRATSK